MSNDNDNYNYMDKKTKERIALFRYGIVAPVVNDSVSNKIEYFRQMADKEHQVPYWINPLTTPKCDDESKKFVITHPFHPLSGKEFEFVSCLNQSGEYRVHFYVEKDRLISIPAHWTNLLQDDPFVKISAGRSYFRVEDLVRLNKLIKDLKGKKDEISQMD